MYSYILKRILYLIPTIFGITFLTFLMLKLAPSDPITMQYTARETVGDITIIEKEKEKFGLNDPFIVQYINWGKKVLKGDFGIALSKQKPVREELGERFPYTIALASASIILTLLISIPLGIIAAIYKNKWIDYLIRALSFIGISMPTFWLGMLLMYLFGIKLRILPIIGGKGIKILIMPSITLSLWLISNYVTRIRASVLEEINKDYVIGLLSRGLSYKRVIFFNVLPNSLLTVLTMFGATVGAILGGATMVETIFEYPGIGKMAVEAIVNRDYFLMQGYVMWMATVYTIMNLAVDILYKYFNPKMRLEERD